MRGAAELRAPGNRIGWLTVTLGALFGLGSSAIPPGVAGWMPTWLGAWHGGVP